MATDGFSVTCECGNRIAVTAAKAGASVPCECGRSCAVPMLSQLRRDAGRDAYVTNAAEAARKAINSGDLPGTTCLHCHGETSRIIRCKVICESSSIKQRTTAADANFVDLFGKLLSPVWITRTTVKTEVQGRDTVVEPVFCLCQFCQNTLGNPRRRRNLKRLLQMIPQYAPLFEEYPRAKVRFLEMTEP